MTQQKPGIGISRGRAELIHIMSRNPRGSPVNLTVDKITATSLQLFPEEMRVGRMQCERRGDNRQVVTSEGGPEKWVKQQRGESLHTLSAQRSVLLSKP